MAVSVVRLTLHPLAAWLAAMLLLSIPTAAQERVARHEPCRLAANPSFQITRTRIDAQSTPVKTTTVDDMDLKFSEILELQGPGADCIAGYNVGFLLFRSGAVFKVVGDSRIVAAAKERTPFAIAVSQIGPKLQGKRPSSVAARDFGDVDTRRLGIWNSGDGGTIAVFDARPDLATAPVVIGTSSVRLGQINFFPSPDSPSGSVSIVIMSANDRVQILLGVLVDARERRLPGR